MNNDIFKNQKNEIVNLINSQFNSSARSLEETTNDRVLSGGPSLCCCAGCRIFTGTDQHKLILRLCLLIGEIF